MTKKEKVAKVMSEFYKQELHSSSGEVVKNPKQAIAIALSEAGLSKKHKSGGALSEHKTFYVPVIIDKNDRWEIVGHPSESISEAQSKLTKIPRGSVGKVINRDEVLEHWSTRGREYLKDGGNIDNENALMVANNNKQIAHHTKEMQELLKENKNIPAWVVAKVNRSASDLSDATHYMEGEGESFANGGGVGNELNLGTKIEFLQDIFVTQESDGYDSERGVGGKVLKIVKKDDKNKIYYLKDTAENLTRDDRFPYIIDFNQLKGLIEGKYVKIYNEKFANGGGIGSFYNKAKSLGKKGVDATKKAIHDKQKNIALDVLWETKENLAKGNERKATEMAYSVVENRYAKGGKVESWIDCYKKPLKTADVSEFLNSTKDDGHEYSLWNKEVGITFAYNGRLYINNGKRPPYGTTIDLAKVMSYWESKNIDTLLVDDEKLVVLPEKQDKYDCYTTGYDGRKNSYGNEYNLTLEQAVEFCWYYTDVKNEYKTKENLEKEIKSTPYGKENIIASSGNITGVVVYKSPTMEYAKGGEVLRSVNNFNIGDKIIENKDAVKFKGNNYKANTIPVEIISWYPQYNPQKDSNGKYSCALVRHTNPDGSIYDTVAWLIDYKSYDGMEQGGTVYKNKEDGTTYSVEKNSKGLWTVFGELDGEYERRDEFPEAFESKEDAILVAKSMAGLIPEFAKGGIINPLEKELRHLQRDLNSDRLGTYIEGDTSEEELARKKEREVKLARFNEVLELLRANNTPGFAKGGSMGNPALKSRILWGKGDIARPIVSGKLGEPSNIVDVNFDKELGTRMFKLKVYNPKNDGSFELRWFAEPALRFIPRNYSQIKHLKFEKGGNITGVLKINPEFKYKKIINDWFEDNSPESLKYKIAVDLLKGEDDIDVKYNIELPRYARLLRLLDSIDINSKHEMSWSTLNYTIGEAEEWAKESLKRYFVLEYAKGGSIDKVSMNVPFLIRALEYSKEEAPDDIDLHKKVESIVNASQEGKTLEMKDYNTIFADGGKIDTSIPKEIYNQIGSKAFYMLGAKNIVALSNYTLAFRIRGSKKVNYVKVTLNSLDLYDVEYGKIHASKYKVVSEDKGIYNDMLLKSIERNTGLYTRLFGKGGNITPKFALYEHIYKETPNGTILGKIMEVIDNGSDIEYYVFYNYPKHDLVREQEADLYSTSDND